LRKTLVATLIIIVALGAGVYAYWRSLPSQTGPRVTLTSTPFELSVMLDKTSYSLADNMTMTFCLRNISNETVTIEESDTYGVFNSPAFTLSTVSEGVNTSFNLPGDNPLGVLFPFGYTFSAGNGSIINKFPDGVHFNQAYSIIFQPNASLNQTLNINLNEFNASYTAPTGHPLQKGTYQVTGAFKGSLNYKALYTWETPSITFTLAGYMRGALLPSPDGPKVTLTSSPLELSMSLDKTVYSLENNMSVSFHLKNISNETVTLTWPNWPWRPESNLEGEGKFWLTTTAEGVTNYDGTLLYQGYIWTYSNGTVIENNPSDYIIIPSTYSIDFEPNASINQTLTIDLLQYRDQMHQPIQQGTYQISATLHAYLNDKGPYTWETPSIAFTIR
jgi:hypothetical protein